MNLDVLKKIIDQIEKLTKADANLKTRLTKAENRLDKLSPEKIEKQAKKKDDFIESDPILEKTSELVQEYKLKDDIKYGMLYKYIDKIRGKFNITKEIDKCCMWCVENPRKSKSKITAMRIRNWLDNVLKRHKQEENRKFDKKEEGLLKEHGHVGDTDHYKSKLFT